MVGITPTNSSKLSPRFYGPYRILERTGDVAYHFKLLGKARIHNVFHVRMLKKFDGMPPSEIVSLLSIQHGRVDPMLEKIIGASNVFKPSK
jgi:hypothetical protein